MQDLTSYITEENDNSIRYDVPSYETFEVQKQILFEFLDEYGEGVTIAHPKVEGFYPVFIVKGQHENTQGVLTFQLTMIDDEEVMPKLAYICGVRMGAVKK